MVVPWVGALTLDHFGHHILWNGTFVLGLLSTLLFLLLNKKSTNPL